MYAIVKTGGKQYKVEQDRMLNIELLKAEVGSKVELPAIMFVDEKRIITGKEAEKVTVEAEIVQHGKGEKINIFTYKAKKNVRHRQGHRQPYTRVKITNISVK